MLRKHLEQRLKMKQLLASDRGAVTAARVFPKFTFLEHLNPDRAQAIKQRIGLMPAESWQVVNGDLLTRLPRRDTQREMF